MSYLSLYEPETLTDGDDRRENKQQQHRTDGHGSDTTGSLKEEEEVEPTTWDFSKHGQEELQHELSRYLRKHRIKQAREAEAEASSEAGRAGGSGGGAGENRARGKTSRKWSKGELAKGRSRKKTAPSGVNSPTNTATTNVTTAPANSFGGGSGSSSRKIGSASAMAVQKEKQRRELEMRRREREEEEEEERERLLRPIPVGDGAGSAVVGDLEPKPNSREATQLEHLSRLLWDGEEEPEDFVLSYGKRSRQSLQ